MRSHFHAPNTTCPPRDSHLPVRYSPGSPQLGESMRELHITPMFEKYCNYFITVTGRIFIEYFLQPIRNQSKCQLDQIYGICIRALHIAPKPTPHSCSTNIQPRRQEFTSIDWGPLGSWQEETRLRGSLTTPPGRLMEQTSHEDERGEEGLQIIYRIREARRETTRCIEGHSRHEEALPPITRYVSVRKSGVAERR